MKSWILASLSLFAMAPGLAQEEGTRALSGNKQQLSLFVGGMESSTVPYINNDTKDSSGTIMYLGAYLDYSHKTGLGIRWKSYALPGGSNPGFFLSTLTTYYARYTGNVLPMVAYTRFFQHGNASVPYSPLANELYAHVRVKTPFVDPQVGVDIGTGNDPSNEQQPATDVNVFVAAGHLFLIEESGAKYRDVMLGLWPTVRLNAGTDRYFKYLVSSKYLSRNVSLNRMGYSAGRGNGGQMTGSGMSSGSSTTIIASDNQFGLSNIEAHARVLFLAGRFLVEPSGSLYFPLRGIDRTPYGYFQLNVEFQIY